MSEPTSPTGLPPTTPVQVVGRLVLLVVVCSAMIGVARAGSSLRERYIHEPACTPVCQAKGMRYEGVIQRKKVDTAAACQCVGPRWERAEVPTRFFSDIWVVEELLGVLTSTLGVLMAVGLVGLGIVGGVVAVRRR